MYIINTTIGENVKTKSKILLASVLALLVMFAAALLMALTGAYYSITREATGFLTLNNGVLLDYSGFYNNSEQTEWGKSAELKLFQITDNSVLPGQKINVPAANIGANAKSSKFYARVKLQYKFYKQETSSKGETTDVEVSITDENEIKKIIGHSSDFFSTNFVSSDDGWNYYSVDGKTPATLSSSDGLKSLFTENATINVGIFGYLKNDTNKAESGGFKYNGDEITSIRVVLVVDTLEGEANLSNENWEI